MAERRIKWPEAFVLVAFMAGTFGSAWCMVRSAVGEAEARGELAEVRRDVLERQDAAIGLYKILTNRRSYYDLWEQYHKAVLEYRGYLKEYEKALPPAGGIPHRTREDVRAEQLDELLKAIKERREADVTEPAGDVGDALEEVVESAEIPEEQN